MIAHASSKQIARVKGRIGFNGEQGGKLTYMVSTSADSSTLDDWANARAAIGTARRAEERIVWLVWCLVGGVIDG